MIPALAQTTTTTPQANPLALPFTFLLIGGMMYFLMIRPQRRRAAAQRSLLQSLEVGDEVMTGGGIFGTLKEMDEDEGTVVVEIAPGIDVRMLRAGISQRLTQDEDEDEDDDEDDDAWEGAEDEPEEEADSKP